MKIIHASVVIHSGHPDQVCLATDLPSPFNSDKGSGEPLFLHFDTSRKKGVEYVKEHFRLEPEIINVS
jgi:hypothetical protein